jgi:hypothetical protein
MSANAVIPFEQAPMPAHIAAAFGGESNIPQKASVPSLTFRGKVWRIVLDGEDTVVTRQTDDGPEPVSTVNVVILNFNPKRSRSFYEGAYEEGKNQAPRCWSTDGIQPDKGVTDPISASCATCPNAVKGSKITDNGKAVTACSMFQRLAVIPSTQLDFPPLLLRLAQTSLWDKDNAANEAQGWYAWAQFVDFLRARGVENTAAIAVKIKFDPRVAYPKLLFKADRFLDAAEIEKTKLLWKSVEVTSLLDGSLFEGAVLEEGNTHSAPPPAAAAPSVAPPTPPKRTRATPPPPPPVAQPEEEDEPPASFGKPTPPQAAAPAATEPGAKLAGVLSSWDDE